MITEIITHFAPLHASTPEFVTACFEKGDKDDIVKEHKTRFLDGECDVSVPPMSTKDNSYRDDRQKRCQKKRNEDNEQPQERTNRKVI